MKFASLRGPASIFFGKKSSTAPRFSPGSWDNWPGLHELSYWNDRGHQGYATISGQ